MRDETKSLHSHGTDDRHRNHRHLICRGMVMFGGQAEKAKIAVTKSNHKSIVKFITYAIMKCSLGEDKIFEGNLNCSQVNPSKAGTAAVKVL